MKWIDLFKYFYIRKLTKKANALISYGQEYKVLLRHKDKATTQHKEYLDHNPEHADYLSESAKIKQRIFLYFFIGTALFDAIFCTHSLTSLTEQVHAPKVIRILCSTFLIIFLELALGVFKMRSEKELQVINQGPLWSTVEGRKYLFMLIAAFLFVFGLPAISTIEMLKEINMINSDIADGYITQEVGDHDIATVKLKYSVLGVLSVILHGIFMVAPEKILSGLTYSKANKTIKEQLQLIEDIIDQQLEADGKLNILLSAYLIEEYSFIRRFGKQALPMYHFPAPIGDILNSLRSKIYA